MDFFLLLFHFNFYQNFWSRRIDNVMHMQHSWALNTPSSVPVTKWHRHDVGQHSRIEADYNFISAKHKPASYGRPRREERKELRS